MTLVDLNLYFQSFVEQKDTGGVVNNYANKPKLSQLTALGYLSSLEGGGSGPLPIPPY